MADMKAKEGCRTCDQYVNLEGALREAQSTPLWPWSEILKGELVLLRNEIREHVGEHEIEDAQREECRLLVLGFFEGDAEKTAAWLLTKNPLLGDISPDTMLHLGRGEKLLKFIHQQLLENKRPDEAGRQV